MRARWLLSLIIVILVVACHKPIADVSKVESGDERQQEDVAEVQEILTIETPADECVADWICLDDDNRGYQLGNCSIQETKACVLGCVNGTCRVGKICEAGFKCTSETRKAYQSEGCVWTAKSNCDWKCEDGKCVEKPENYTESVPVETVKVETGLVRLAIGQKSGAVVEDANYTIELYNIEPGRVQLKINGDRSDWIFEGNNYTYSTLILEIKEVLFQNFANGLKEVAYEVK
jgi:hypothetical protein